MFKLVVGLGNPGSNYEKTRHNAGFWFLDRLADEKNAGWSVETRFQSEVACIRFDGRPVYLLKPQAFMNRSGLAVGKIARFYKIEPQEILVAHDELDFEPGVVKIKRGGGHGGHNGLRDIVSHLGSGEFYRLRIGIGHPGDKSKVTNFVLSPPSKSENENIMAKIDCVIAEVDRLLAGDVDKVMNRIH
ncbi:MAG: aminoacyl-tRNA hydrolase [Gammaproteobacteria bacterium]